MEMFKVQPSVRTEKNCKHLIGLRRDTKHFRLMFEALFKSSIAFPKEQSRAGKAGEENYSLFPLDQTHFPPLLREERGFSGGSDG